MDVSNWTPGVTPTWVECKHGARIAEGTYTKDVHPTGEHPECWANFVKEEQDALDQHKVEQWNEYNRIISEGGV